MSADSILIVEDQPQSGAWNMAVDEALLEHSADNGVRTVRVYGWKEPTVSLGYFQDADEYLNAPVWRDLPVVRRLSGGGAILHHHEMTYSCCLPAKDRWSRHPPDLYDVIHDAFVDLLQRRGVTIHKRGPQPSDDSQFLCFARGDERDLIVDGHKVLGSAQRRRRGAVLQHGSLLLARSEHATQFPGLLDLAPSFDPFGDLQRQIGRSIAESIDGDSFEEPACFADSVTRRAHVLLDRYDALEIR